MAQRKNLLSIEYHYDTDTGMYSVGEIDFGISGELDIYLEKYGRKGMAEILKTMCHLIWHVQEYGYKIIKKKEELNTSGPGEFEHKTDGTPCPCNPRVIKVKKQL